MASKLFTMVRNLQHRKGRKRQALTVAEGVRLVEEVLRCNVPCRGVVVGPSLGSDNRGRELLKTVAERAIPIEEADQQTFDSLAGTDTPQGILAVIDPPRHVVRDLKPAEGAPVVVVDGVQDPGNLGAVIRTACALGSPGMVLLKGSADPTNPKVLRAAMGTSFTLPIARAEDDELAAWLESTRTALWTTGSDGNALGGIRLPESLAVVVGNEGAGVRAEIAQMAERCVTIPLSRGVESLNVAVAAGIFLYEVQRAR